MPSSNMQIDGNENGEYRHIDNVQFWIIEDLVQSDVSVRVAVWLRVYFPLSERNTAAPVRLHITSSIILIVDGRLIRMQQSLC